MADKTQDLEFTTAKRKAKPVNFTLDGEEYTFTPPKAAELTLAIVGAAGGSTDQLAVTSLKAQFDWLDAGLPKKQAKRIEARLRDPEDDLDTDQVLNVIKVLTKKVAGGRPTT